MVAKVSTEILIKKFRKKISEEGRSFKWFHGIYASHITYSYFIIMINDSGFDRMHGEVKEAIESYVNNEV